MGCKKLWQERWCYWSVSAGWFTVPAKSIWFWKICFHYQNYVLKKTNKQGYIFVSNNNFERVTNIFGEITHWQYKSMRLQRNFFCGHAGLLWTPVIKLGGIWVLLLGISLFFWSDEASVRVFNQAPSKYFCPQSALNFVHWSVLFQVTLPSFEKGCVPAGAQSVLDQLPNKRWASSSLYWSFSRAVAWKVWLGVWK